MMTIMDSSIIQKLRQDQALVTLPDGGEGVQVTLEYPGPIPEPSRAGRKKWLCGHFQGVMKQLKQDGIGLVTSVLEEGISTSGQSLRAAVPVKQLAQLREHLEQTKHKMGIITRHQAEADQ